MNYPIDTVQYMADEWWEEDRDNEIRQGSLVKVIFPFLEKIPYRLKLSGRTNPTEHSVFDAKIESYNLDSISYNTELPVAALPNVPKSHYGINRTKTRPALVLIAPDLNNNLPGESQLAIHQKESPLIVAPYYGVTGNSNKTGYPRAFIEEVRRAYHRRFFWDLLPIPRSDPGGSILRLDKAVFTPRNSQISYTKCRFKLTDYAYKIIIEWLNWLISGLLPKDTELWEIIEIISPEMVNSGSIEKKP